MALEIPHEEAKPLELKISWMKTKVMTFEGLLDDRSVCLCTRRDVEIINIIFVQQEYSASSVSVQADKYSNLLDTK